MNVPRQQEIPTIAAYKADLVPAGHIPGLKPDARVALFSLVDQIEPPVKLGREPHFRAYTRADAQFITDGLIIDPDTATDGKNMAHTIRLGNGGGRKLRGDEDPKDKRPFIVNFQPEEFKVVALSPEHLGTHMENRTQASRRQWDASQVRNYENAMRSGGHTLEGYMESQAELIERLKIDNDDLASLITHITNPGVHRIRAHILDRKLAAAMNKVHDAGETALLYYNFGKDSINQGVHKVIKRRVYNGNYSHAERTAFLLGYLQMVGSHNRAKVYKLGVSKARSQQVYDAKYKPFIDKEEARKNAEQQAQAA